MVGLHAVNVGMMVRIHLLELMYQVNKNLERRHRNKKRLKDAFGGECGICGYDRCSRALEFHHLYPQRKKFGLGSKSWFSWKRMVEEARGCVLLCANCHMEVEEGLILIPENIQRFDESYATYVNSQGTIIG